MHTYIPSLLDFPIPVLYSSFPPAILHMVVYIYVCVSILNLFLERGNEWASRGQAEPVRRKRPWVIERGNRQR